MLPGLLSVATSLEGNDKTNILYKTININNNNSFYV